MVTDIIIVYNDKNQLTELNTDNYPIKFKFIDSLAKKSKKEAWRVKSNYAAKLDPFVVVLNGDKPIKAFYTEAEDVINSLIKYLNDIQQEI